VYWRLANLPLGADNLAQSRIVLFVHVLFASGHALIADGQQLSSVLLPCVECILFLFVGEIAIPDNIISSK
jgi:hypothetical protein